MTANISDNTRKYHPKFQPIPEGTKFSEWVVEEYLGHSQYLCRCSCGTIGKVSSVDLKKGLRTRCRRCQIGFSEKESSFRTVYRTYQANAKTANREFSLSKDQAKELFESDCHYCGIKPSQRRKTRWSSDDPDAIFYYNGIDRIDSNVGYIYENCLPCCYVCNHMKYILSYDDFLEHIRLIYKHRVGENG